MAKQVTVTSADLLKQSDALRQQAEALKAKEIPEVVARMKEAIAHYNLTAEQLGLAAGSAPAKKVKAVAPVAATNAPKKVARSSVVKYRDNAGHSWTGFGPRPKWLKEAIAAGASEESLQAK